MPILLSDSPRHAHPPSELVTCSLGPNGRFNKFSPGWYSICRQFELVDFEPDRLLGSTLWDLLSARVANQAGIGDQLRGLLAGELSALVPNADLSPIETALWQAWIPWPDGSDEGPAGLTLTLRSSAQQRLMARLEDPLFRGSHEPSRTLRPVNAAARRLLESHPELAESLELERWLCQQSQPRQLTTLNGLSLHGEVLWMPTLPSLHGESSFLMLGKLVRTLLHDLSNPLSAVRMMAEVASRGSRHYSDPSKVLPDMIRHLDMSISTMGQLRGLIQVDSRSRTLNAIEIISGAGSLLQTELDRREVSLDLSGLVAPEPELVGHTDAFLLLALGAILMTLGRAGESDTLVLSAELDDELWRLEGSLRASDAPRPWFADPDLGIDTFERLLAPFQGRLRCFRLGADPFWSLEIPL